MTSPVGAARALLVGYLAPLEEDGIRVLEYARKIDPPAHPTVLVRYDRVRPAGKDAGARRVRSYEFGLLCVPAKSTGAPAEDEAGALLDDVLAVLDDAPNVLWSVAERGTFEDSTYPAHEITVTLPLKIGA